VCAFLDVTGATETGYEPEGEPDHFAIGEEIPKDRGKTYQVLVDNFTKVEAGEAYAKSEREPVLADERFYPILMSEDGYVDALGYRGERVADDIEGALEYFSC